MEMKRGDLQAADEPVLLDAAIEGDIEAFGQLHERYRSDLYAICLRRLNDPSLAEDAVQDIFIRGFSSIPNFDPKKPFWPWLVAIAFRACIDIQRRRSLTHYSGDIEISMEAGGNGHTESALDEVITSEERAELWKSLDVLPERQRRAFVLYEVDGLSCADIAAAEGISVAAVYRLLFRARKKIRSVHQGGPLPAIVFPFTWLRWKLQQLEERVRPFLGYSEGFSSACAQAACLGALVTMAIAASLPNAPLDGNDTVPWNETVLSSAQSLPPQTASPAAALPRVASPAKTLVDPPQPVAGSTSSLVDEVINPNQNATPENSSLTSIMASPNYENDHTVLALGGSVLFVSNDGGASWKPMPSRLMFASTYMALPPGYPHDRRIFTLGDAVGLQQSDDGGSIFRPVSPLLGWSLAISPSFGRGDSRLLIGGRTVFEYDADLRVTKPSQLAIPTAKGVYRSILFDASSPDSRVFISDSSDIHYRCDGFLCSEIQLPKPNPVLSLSPRFTYDGRAFALTSAQKILESNDGLRTFREIQFPLPDPGWGAVDGAVLWDESGPTIFVLAMSILENRSPGGAWSYSKSATLSWSADSGISWESNPVDLSYFRYGNPGDLIVTPTRRVLITGMYGGIACSADLGQTWAPRCPPEQ